MSAREICTEKSGILQLQIPFQIEIQPLVILISYLGFKSGHGQQELTKIGRLCLEIYENP
jgi:hypothetical protein